MVLEAKIVLMNRQDMWLKEMELPIPPFPGLGIRIDTYEMLNVDRVVIGDNGYEVTCIVSPEGGQPLTAKQCQGFGFQQREGEPSGSIFIEGVGRPEKNIAETLQEKDEKSALKALIFFDGWVKEMRLPFPPFVGLGIRFDQDRVLNVWSVVTGDFHFDVTCITEYKGLPFTEAEWERFGFERGSYP